jgi:uncharacterized membrane protein HdeD (DUF308 family)
MSVPEREESLAVVEESGAPGPVRTSGPSAVADHWGLVLALGILTVGLGIVLSVWPKATLGLLAVLVSLQLMLSGLVSLVSAVGSRTLDRSAKALVGLSGIIAVLLSLVLLRAPQQTLVVVSLLVGVWWVFKGLVDVVRALADGSRSGTPWVWNLAVGGLTAIVGAVVVLNPQMSFGVLLVIVEVWLFGYGFLTIVAAFGMRAAAARPEPAPVRAGA